MKIQTNFFGDQYEIVFITRKPLYYKNIDHVGSIKIYPLETTEK